VQSRRTIGLATSVADWMLYFWPIDLSKSGWVVTFVMYVISFVSLFVLSTFPPFTVVISFVRPLTTASNDMNSNRA